MKKLLSSSEATLDLVAARYSLKVLPIELLWTRQRPCGLEPHHDIDGALREENRNRQRIGTAERVKDGRRCGRVATEFSLLERAHRGQALTLKFGPGAIQFVPVFFPRRIILKLG